MWYLHKQNLDYLLAAAKNRARPESQSRSIFPRVSRKAESPRTPRLRLELELECTILGHRSSNLSHWTYRFECSWFVTRTQFEFRGSAVRRKSSAPWTSRSYTQTFALGNQSRQGQ